MYFMKNNLKTVSIAAVFILTLPFFAFPSGAADLTRNFALKKPVSVSGTNAGGSENLNAGKPGGNAVDGDTSTEFETYASADKGFVQVDLRDEISVSRVAVRQAKASRMLKYEILYSVDGKNWETAQEATDSAAAVITADFTPVRARYIKFNILRVTPNGGYLGYGVSEFEVYGEEADAAGNPGIYIDDIPKGSKLYEAAALASTLGIIPSGGNNFEPDSLMTRGEFTAALLAAFGRGVSVSGKLNPPYKDVPAGHPYFEAINTAAEFGIVNREYSVNFYPDDYITHFEAAEMTVYAMGGGYRVRAEALGEAGYTVLASQLRLTGGAVGDTVLTKGSAAVMMLSTLKTEVMEPSYFKDGDVAYIKTNKDFLAENFDIYRGSGRIASVFGTSVDRAEGTAKGEAKINGTTFKTGDCEAAEFLGRYVNYYFYENETEAARLILIAENSGDDTITKVDAGQIEESSANGELIYLSGSKSLKKSISPTANIIYNGRYSGKAHSQSGDIFKPVTGFVELIDENADGYVNTVIIRSYETYAVNSVNLSDGFIYDKYGKKPLNIKEEPEREIYIKKGTRNIRPFLLKNGDILLAAVSRDESFSQILMSDERVKGAASEVDSENKSAVINGKEYKISKGFLGDKPVDVNIRTLFLLDAFGNIAAVDLEGAQKGYGYLIGVSAENKLGGGALFKLLTRNGNIEIFHGAENMRVDGVKFQSAQAQKDNFSFGGDTLRQLIVYKLNGNDEISEIYTEASAENENLPVNLTENAELTNAKYKSRPRVFNLQYGINPDTAVFFIPSDGDVKNEKKYKTGDYTDFANDQPYDVKFYDSDKLHIAKAVVTPYKPLISDSYRPGVVQKIADVKNGDGDTVKKIYVLTGSGTVEATAADTAALTDGASVVSVGDVVQFSSNQNGEIESVKVLFDNDRIVVNETDKCRADSAETKNIYGQVRYKSDSAILISETGSDGDMMLFYTDTASVYIFDRARQYAYTAGFDGIISAEDGGNTVPRVFLYTHYDDPVIAVIYK
jgi:hypothetical protein